MTSLATGDAVEVLREARGLAKVMKLEFRWEGLGCWVDC